MRVASNTTGGDIHLNIDEKPSNAELSIGFTGGWQEWVTIDTEIELSAGEQTLRFTFSYPDASDDLMNVNWINFEGGNNLNFLPVLYELLLN